MGKIGRVPDLLSPSSFLYCTQRLTAYEYQTEVDMEAAFFLLILTVARLGIPLLFLFLLGALVEHDQAAKL